MTRQAAAAAAIRGGRREGSGTADPCANNGVHNKAGCVHYALVPLGHEKDRDASPVQQLRPSLELRAFAAPRRFIQNLQAVGRLHGEEPLENHIRFRNSG